MTDLTVAFGALDQELNVKFGTETLNIYLPESTVETARLLALAEDAQESTALALAQALDALAELDPDRAAVIETLTGGYGAFWEVDRSTVFTDLAGTTPVTGTGQLVRCIKAAYGGSDYDLIQADDAKRPTYFEAYGLGFVRCDNGKSMYSRANVTMKCPSFIGFAGKFASATLERAFFGLAKNTGTRHQLQVGTLANVIANAYGDAADISRANVQANGAELSAPQGRIGVYHSLLAADGTIDSRFNDSTVTSGTIEAATAWVSPNSVAGMSIVLNGGGQSLGIGTTNADASCDFYGGIALQREPGNREAIVRWLYAQCCPAITADDQVILIIGDSTGDDNSSEAGGTAVDEVFYRFAGESLPSRYPNDVIVYRAWSRVGDAVLGDVRMTDGTLTGRTFVVNLSSAGSQPGYFMGERFERTIATLPRVDVVIWNHGHNLPVSGDILAHADRELYRVGEFLDAMDQVRVAFPAARHMMVRVYPKQTTGDESMAPVVEAVDEVAALYGDVDLIDLYTAWAARTNAWYLNDDTHPSVPTGVTEMLGPLVTAYDALSDTPIAPAIANGLPVLSNLLANGAFADWPGAVPVSWTLFGDAAVTKAGSALRLTASNGGLRQVITATAYQGTTVALMVRQSIAKDSDANAGSLRFKCNGASTIGDGDWIYVPYKVWDRFRDFYHLFPVPADATTLTIEIIGGLTGTGEVLIERAVLVEGETPRDLVAVA